VFIDADTLIVHPDIAFVFAALEDKEYDLLAVADEPQSASKRALGDIDMFNTGFLAFRRGAPEVQKMLDLWVGQIEQIATALGKKNHEGIPNSPDNLLGTDKYWKLVLNDQFSFAHIVTPSHHHPEVANLRCAELPRRFNYRGDGSEPNKMVVNHTPAYKMGMINAYEEHKRKKQLEEEQAKQEAEEADEEEEEDEVEEEDDTQVQKKRRRKKGKGKKAGQEKRRRKKQKKEKKKKQKKQKKERKQKKKQKKQKKQRKKKSNRRNDEL